MSDPVVAQELKRLWEVLDSYVGQSKKNADVMCFEIDSYLQEESWSPWQVRDINDLIVDAKKFISLP